MFLIILAIPTFGTYGLRYPSADKAKPLHAKYSYRKNSSPIWGKPSSWDSWHGSSTAIAGASRQVVHDLRREHRVSTVLQRSAAPSRPEADRSTLCRTIRRECGRRRSTPSSSKPDQDQAG